MKKIGIRLVIVVFFFGTNLVDLKAAGIQLIVNGGFETGNFAGWTVNNTGAYGNDFYVIANGANVPASGHPTQVNPGGGQFVAASDQFGPGGEELRQGFTVLPGYKSLSLTFDWFNNTHYPYMGMGIDGSDQAGRVDILTLGAAPFDVGGGVVMNLLLNAGSFTSFGTTIPWQSTAFDLSALAPGNYELRFGNGQCCFYQEMGVDNVSLLAETSVPEPATITFLVVGLAGLAGRKFAGPRPSV
jgi:hypothetical protein